MAAVFELEIPATEKLVLLAMADHARDDGTGCYPSVQTLAQKTSQSRRGVQGIMRRLEQAGLIIPSSLSRGRRSTEYRITLTNREQGSLFVATQPRTPAHPTANLTARNREPGSPEPLRTVIEPKPLPAPQAGDPRSHPFTQFATETFKAKHGGQAPTWNGKDFKSLAELLRCNPNLPQEELRRRWVNYLASTEGFIQSQGDSLAFFCGHFDRFIDGPQKNGGRNGASHSGEKRSGGLPPIPGKYEHLKTAVFVTDK